MKCKNHISERKPYVDTSYPNIHTFFSKILIERNANVYSSQRCGVGNVNTTKQLNYKSTRRFTSSTSPIPSSFDPSLGTTMRDVVSTVFPLQGNMMETNITRRCRYASLPTTSGNYGYCNNTGV